MESEKNFPQGEKDFFQELFDDNYKIRIVTRTGWQSDICYFKLHKSGLVVTKGPQNPNNSNQFFVPFDSIDHVQIY